jgi:hypothetical protein
MRSKITVGGLVVALGISVLSVTGTADAGAAAAGTGCSYPQVCLYKGSALRNPTGRFRDVTRGWQYLSRSRGARAFVNTRRNDVAYLLTTSGRVICVRPGDTGGLAPGAGGVKAIRISYSPRC